MLEKPLQQRTGKKNADPSTRKKTPTKRIPEGRKERYPGVP
jgi:hypothetical protein